jgi:transposase
MRAECARLSRHADIAKAMDYMLKRWLAFSRVLDDGRVCLSNNAARARSLRDRSRAPHMAVRWILEN